MSDEASNNINQQISDIYRRESRRAYATLVRLLGDFSLAEEMLHEAFATAMEKWPCEGIPENPRSWLVSTARFKAIDAIRRNSRLSEMQPDIVARMQEIDEHNTVTAGREIQDDTLRLIFTCCHPAIDPKVQVPLTLREVCGLTTEEIASAFLVAPPTMAQRIVRGKAKIAAAGIPYTIPSRADLPERLDAVLSVIYLVFNEGYSASAGHSAIRADLTGEAIRLTRLVLELLPDPEVMGLLALMLLHESRRETRLNRLGDIVILEDQDRSLWNHKMIAEGERLVEQSLSSRRFGVYSIQAAISAVHAGAATSAETDWPQIVALYDILLRAESSPIIELNRAVALAMRDGPESGLAAINAILDRGDLEDYSLAHSARGELLRRIGNNLEAKVAFQKALGLARQEPERRFLTGKISNL